jgi:hypothetical protein
MTREIDGFIVGPCNTNAIIAERIAEPRCGYVFECTPKGIKLLHFAPSATTQEDRWDEEAKRHEGEATAAAKKYWDLLFAAAAE